MAKKKAIKLAAASAVAASAFVAAAPAQTDAASNVAVEVSKAVTQMKKAYHTYSDVTAQGKFAPIADVYKEYNAAKKAYANAKALVNKAGGADKDKHLAALEDTYAEYIAKRVITYIDAYNYATTLQDKQIALEEALKNKDWDAAEKQYHAISYELKTRTVILDRVYGKSTRELLRGSFKADAQAARDSIQNEVSVKIYFDKAEGLLNDGKLEEAKAAMDHVADYVAKLDKDTDFGAALLAKVAAAKEKYEELSVPAVKSVSAINAKTIEVKFNKEVSQAEAQNVNNYTFVGVTGFGNPVLKEDGKTVVLTSSTAIANDTTFVVTVSEIATKADANVKTAKYTKTLTFSDTVRPAFSNVTYPKPGVAELNFSEELSTEGNVVVYDGLVESTTVTKSLDGSKITLGALELNKEYKVVITGAKDQSGNLIAAPVQVTVKSSVSDTVKPVVSSITSQGIDTVKVQFSEAIQATSGVYASIEVNGVATTGTTQAFDAKTNILTVSGITGISNGEVKSITVKDFKDLANLNGETVTKVIAFSTAAPALQSTQVVKEGTKTFAVLTFDKAVPTIASTVNASYVTSENVYKNTTLPASVDVDKKQVKLEVTGKDAGAYTVSFAAGEISDGKTSNDKALEVKFNVGTSVDSSIPEVSNVFLPGDALPSGATVEAGAVYVKYDKSMSASALNADNYTVDGSSVFSNPIFVGDKTLVKLTIKDSAITVSGSRNFAISNAVKGENNVAIKSYAVVKSFDENVKPVLTSASLVDDMTIELVFSELLGTTGFTTADNDFLVTVGGTKNVVTAVTDGTVGDNKVRVTITDKITAEQLVNSTIAVKTLETADITDKVGNKLTANTVVNVAK
ncbi:hypothetical protein [Cytobacillus oceanisediminis]|uniref:SbsC C-terminal domain-containing protein n=1 Tax=Cytobacillus oceanisediminis TaxID=665099 RepID=A0ABX3CWS1_9BACI|nr:hypothetical protein [Cytobacillus oceanisediminis]OHX49948.1 hypothetical protein BBV17_10665 [Cytobacillus oceanisediminis]